MSFRKPILSLFLVLLITAATATVFAQGVQTATLTGNVTGPDGIPLPGVQVTATSPALIGERTTYTGANGDYIIRGLAPGDYTVRFDLAGMQVVESRANLPLGGTTRVDAAMALSVAAEAITVTAEVPSALETSTTGANITKEQVEMLPVGRTPTSIAALAAGVSGGDREGRTPVAGQISIAGGMAYDNNFMVNGVNVQDPIFGTANNLFVEDAIQETQIMTSGITAEYGHFSGGVMNVITKSGGNDFSGSLRADLTKPEWRDETPYEKGFRGEGAPRGTPTERKGDMGEVWSATLGGPIMRDRLWFFGAIRDEENTNPAQLAVSGINVPRVQTNQRYEIKLTGSIGQNHSLMGSYVENPVEATHEIQVAPIELAAVGLNSERVNDGTVVSYNGVLTSNLFAEARWSEKNFGFRGLGGTETGIVDSPMRALNRHRAFAELPGTGTFNAPYFDATDPEDRNNESIYGALSYFLSTKGFGSHDFKGGIEQFIVTRTGGNSQSSTSYVFYTPYLTQGGAPVIENGRFVPRFISAETSGTAYTALGWWVSTRGASLDLTTDSIYLQDRWDINENWTANIGVRHEQVTSDTAGANVVGFDTSTTMPRLGITFDPLADGRFKFDVTYGEYAGRYNPAAVAENSPVGTPALLYGYYIGPDGSGRDFAPGFDLNNYVFYYASVPTANIFVDEELSSPVSQEFTVSAGMALPRGGWFKGTFVSRETQNFIEDFITPETGFTNVVFEGVDAGLFDNAFYTNSDVPERSYQAILLQARHNVTRRWQVEGNYTYQIENDGNYEGEAGQSIGTSGIGNYPEMQSPRSIPTGRLSQFQEHKLRLWTTYNFDFGRAGNLGAGLIYRYDSPLTFSYSTTVAYTAIQRALDPGYKSPPSSQTIFFGERGAGEYNDTSLVDVSLNYAIPVFRGIEPWIKIDIANVLNDDTLRTFGSAIAADPNSPKDALGLPTGFTKPASFGRPTGAGSYVVPREYFVSAGIRF